MDQVIYVLVVILFALIDPFVFLPAVLLGLFVRRRYVAIFSSIMIGVLIGYAMFLMRIDLGDTRQNLFPFVSKLVAAGAITYLVHLFKSNRKSGKSG